MTVLRVEGLCKQYPKFQLKDVSFSLEKGRIMGFIGRNGAGKTTTLKSLLNFVHPDAGEIEFFGNTLAQDERGIKQKLGFVSGGVEFYPHKKLGAITRVTRSFYDNWDDGACAEYMRRFALDGDKTPEQLSAGMKVKYALTLALSHNAQLLILDEPTSGLDPVSRDELTDIFLSLVREKGVSILFSTHITSDLDKCADDIAYIRGGRIVEVCELDAFVDGWRLVRFSEGEVAKELMPLLVGCRQGKKEFTALVRAQDAGKLPATAEKADLETIMVHLEREGEAC